MTILDRLKARKENLVAGVDVVDGKLTFRRYDGSKVQAPSSGTSPGPTPYTFGCRLGSLWVETPLSVVNQGAVVLSDPTIVSFADFAVVAGLSLVTPGGGGTGEVWIEVVSADMAEKLRVYATYTIPPGDDPGWSSPAFADFGDPTIVGGITFENVSEGYPTGPVVMPSGAGVHYMARLAAQFTPAS